jgi:hypothetical protein
LDPRFCSLETLATWWESGDRTTAWEEEPFP